MAGIFISYRRGDVPGHAGRIFDRLRARFGADAVFMDVQGIDTGADFVESIERAVGACGALVAVIGPGWAEATDQAGRRRLDDPADFVRLEIAHALRRGIRVLPVLVENARLPGAGELSPELAPLLRRQALSLRDDRWDSDVEDLIGSLARSAPSRRAPAFVGAGVTALLVVAGSFVMLRSGDPVPPSPEAVAPTVGTADRAVAGPPPVAAAPAPLVSAPARSADTAPPLLPPARSGLGLLWLGIRSDRGSVDPAGVHVSYVYPGGPAAAAGIAAGDVLVEVNGSAVTRFGQLQDAVTASANDAPGATSEVVLMRGGRTMQVPVVFDRGFRPQD